MDQLVVSALQKGGVNRHHRFDAFTRQTRCKRQRMLLGNAHIKVTVGEALVKLHHARALAHGRCDAHQQWVVLGHVTQPLTKDLGERGFGHATGGYQAHGRIEFSGAMVGHRVGLGQVVALSLFSDHMQKLWPL